MKYVRLGLVAAAAFGYAQVATAADMPLKAAPAPAAVIAQNWSGFYIGGHGGWAQASQTMSVVDPATLFGGAGAINAGTVSSSNNGSGVVGIHGGYNWQFSSWVFGIEADYSWASMQTGGQIGPPLVFPVGAASATFINLRDDVRNLGTVRGRLGYTWDNLLLYATGGWAYAQVDFNGDFFCGVGVTFCATAVHAPLRFSDTLSGYVLGGGVEFKGPTSPWVLGLEYLFYHLDAPDSRTVATFNAVTGAPISFNPALCPAGTPCVAYSFSDLEIHSIRARLSYKF